MRHEIRKGLKGSEERPDTWSKGSGNLCQKHMRVQQTPSCQTRQGCAIRPSSGHTGEWSQPQKYQKWRESRRISHSVTFLTLPHRALAFQIAFHGATDGEQVQEEKPYGDSNRADLFLFPYVCSFHF